MIKSKLSNNLTKMHIHDITFTKREVRVGFLEFFLVCIQLTQRKKDLNNQEFDQLKVYFMHFFPKEYQLMLKDYLNY